MHIRPALPSEAAALSALALAAKAAWGYPASQLLAWRKSLAVTARQLGEQPAAVADEDGTRLGFYTLCCNGSACELDNLWVAPAWMRRGIGRTLLAHAAHTARQLGAAEVRIDADPHAEPFCRRCGAIRCGEVAAPIAGQAQRVRPQLVLHVPAAAIPDSAPLAAHAT